MIHDFKLWQNRKTMVGLLYLIGPHNTSLENMLYYCLFFPPSSNQHMFFRIYGHSWVQKSATVSTGYRVFRSAECHSDSDCYCYWDLL